MDRSEDSWQFIKMGNLESVETIVCAPFRGWPFGRVRPGENVEGADYTIINNPKSRRYAENKYRHMRQRRGFIRWAVFFIVGFMAAGMYKGIFAAIEALNDKKFSLLMDRIENHDAGSAFLLYFTIMIALVMGAMLVVLLVPLAGGGGVPEVKKTQHSSLLNVPR